MNITRSTTTYNTTTSNVTLSWNRQVVGRVDMYHVNVSYEPDQVTKYFTNTPVVRVEGIPYNQQVTISIAAVNCHSESEITYFNVTISESQLVLRLICKCELDHNF